MSLARLGPEQRSRFWALMQRIERCRHRADLAEAKTASGSTAFRTEMAEIAQEWRDLARQIEAEDAAPGALAAKPGEGEPSSHDPSAALVGRARGPLRSPADFVVGIVIGTLGALTLAAPRWVEASTGIDIDRGTGALEWAVTCIAPIAGVGAALAMRVRAARPLAREGR
jgi:hypothetical protein